MRESRGRKKAAPLAKKEVRGGRKKAAGVPEVRASHWRQTKNGTKKGDSTMEATTVFSGIDLRNVNEDVLKIVKSSLGMTFDSIAKVRELNDKIARDMIKTNREILADVEKITGEWIESGKAGWEEYRTAVEKGIKQAEALMHPAK